MITLIAITAYGAEEESGRAKEAGFDHLLAKPVPFYSILSLIGSPRRASPSPGFAGS
jgi:hypothetical protein